jgi:hypothetical protein
MNNGEIHMKKLISIFAIFSFIFICSCSSVKKIDSTAKVITKDDGMVTIIIKGKVQKMTYENWKILSDSYMKK